MINPLMKMLRDRPESLRLSKESGSKIVGYFCAYIPEELITAAGMIPLRLVSGTSPEAMHAGEQYLQSYTCPYIRTCIGNKATGNPYYEMLDAVCVACTCDGMKKLQEYWKKYFNIPVFTVGVPQTSNRFRTRKQAIDYFREELDDLKKNLEKLSGTKITNKRLREAVRTHNLIRGRMRRLYDYLKEESSSISWRDVFQISHAGFLVDRPEFLKETTRIVGELKTPPRVEKKTDTRTRIMLYGSVMALEDTKVLDLVERARAKIVADALCTGSRFWRKDVSLDGPLMEGLVERYLHNTPCPNMTDTAMRLNYVIAGARGSHAQGMIYYSLKSCDTFRSEVKIFKEALKKELNIPTLLIETEYSPADIGTTRTKIEAFLEMLRGV